MTDSDARDRADLSEGSDVWMALGVFTKHKSLGGWVRRRETGVNIGLKSGNDEVPMSLNLRHF